MGIVAPERVSSPTERLRNAQQVLAAAEAAAGLRAMLPQAPGSQPTSQLAAAEQGTVGGHVRARVAGAVVTDRFLPVPEALTPLIPFGGLRRGSAVRVEGSASLLLAMTAAACRDGAWCAVVGMPNLGLAAAVDLGLPLDRVALVPRVGADAPAVLAAAIDGFDVIMLGDVPHLIDRDRRRLASRLRHRDAVLLCTGAWPGVDLVLSATESRWSGVGQGCGSLHGRDLTIRVNGRGAGGYGVQGRFRSPDGVSLLPVFSSGAAVDGGGPVPELGRPSVLERWAG